MFIEPFYFFYLIAFVIIGVLAFHLLRGLAEWLRNNQSPRETKQATVVAKRFQVSGGGQQQPSQTTYYLTFEFLDRQRLEYRVKASIFGQLVEGDRGILTYQGSRFLDFNRQ